MTQNYYYLHAKRMIILLFISAFGPYVFPNAGIRVEHFFIYPLFLYVIMKVFVSQNSLQFNRFVFALLYLLILTLTWITTVSYLKGGFENIYGALAGLENFTQPIALILISSWYFSKLDQSKLLGLFHVACATVIVLLSINTMIGTTTIFYDTWPFLKYFVVSDAGDGMEIESIAKIAASLGRFSGIFNQPLEGGVAYSIGILCWVYLAHTTKNINYLRWFTLSFLLIGGAISVSKVFILVGFPLALLYWGWLNIGKVTFRKSTIVGFFVTVAVFIGVVTAFADYWTGLDYFVRLFGSAGSSDGGFIYTYTAGRFGLADTVLKQRFAYTWSESPIIGLGVPVIGALDNAYLEFFYLGGIVALTFYVVMLLIIGYIALVMQKNDSKCGKFLFLLWLLIVIAGMGAPMFTINRSSIFLWILLILGILILSRRPSINY